MRKELATGRRYQARLADLVAAYKETVVRRVVEGGGPFLSNPAHRPTPQTSKTKLERALEEQQDAAARRIRETVCICVC